MQGPDTRTLLLVEDNSDDEELTLRAFAKSGNCSSVIVARDGAHAIRLLFGDEGTGKSEFGLLPSLVILDLKLPRVGGLEVLAKIREHPRTRTLPVVVLTSSDEAKDIEESYRLGANSYIRKPVDFDEYLDAIRQMEQYWLDVNRCPDDAVLK